ncbi:MAG TPA: hypothetical protein VJR50_12770 [Mycobacterium sp.]|nr:hypothetical protein [Mycobacterium sp.]
MTEPKPPLARVTERVAQTAKEMLDDSAAVVSAESKKIDADDYHLKDAVSTVTQLAGIGITGAAHIGRIAIEEKPPDTVLAMGEYIASVLRRMVTQTGTVAQVASIDLENKTYTAQKWLESMTRLIDIGISGGMEIVETVAAGPARFEVQPRRSDPFDATRHDENRELTLTLVAGDIRRDATESQIPATQITFDPPTLPPHDTTFTVLVDASGLASGVYEGTVFAQYADAKAENGIARDPVNVSIEL